MGKTKRPYDKEGAREIRTLNRRRKAMGLPPITRKRKKTNRKYVYSGFYAGANGGKRRKFRDATIQRKMETSQSPYIDKFGASVKTQANSYRGKYRAWFEKKNVRPKEKSNRSIAV